jgi:(p)ppGpp synthase/HD superfamily hydrolase
MNSVEGDDLKMVAVLHDTLEDTFITRDYLEDAGYPEHIIAAVEGVTKRPDEDGSDEGYTRFVRRAAQNPLSRMVKIADLRDNMDASRLKKITPGAQRRIAKYQRALAELEAKS